MQCPEIVSYTQQCFRDPELFEPEIFSARIDMVSNHQLLALRDKLEKICGNALRLSNGQCRELHDDLCHRLAVQQISQMALISVWNLGFCLDYLFFPNMEHHCGGVEHISGNGLLLGLAVKKIVLHRLKMRDAALSHTKKVDRIFEISKRINTIIGKRCELIKKRNQSVFEQRDEHLEGRGQELQQPENSPNTSWARFPLPFHNARTPLLGRN